MRNETIKICIVTLFSISTCYALTPQMQGSFESLPKKLAPNECVIACYKRVNGDIKVAGYYSTAGNYKEGACRPGGFMGDISPASSSYSQQCASVKNCEGAQCWAGGDTGEFFGM